MNLDDRELFVALGVLNSQLSAFAFALQEDIPVAVDEQIALGHRLVDLAEMIRDRATTQSQTVVEGAAGAVGTEQQSAIDTQTVAAIELGEQFRTDSQAKDEPTASGAHPTPPALPSGQGNQRCALHTGHTIETSTTHGPDASAPRALPASTNHDDHDPPGAAHE